MAYELISQNIPVIMIEPGNESAFFPRVDSFTDSVKSISYNDFLNKIQETLKGNSLKIKNTDDFCLNSVETSDRIFNYLSKNYS